MTTRIRVLPLSRACAAANVAALESLTGLAGAVILDAGGRFRTCQFEHSFFAVDADQAAADDGTYPDGAILAVLVTSADHEGHDSRVEASGGDAELLERLRGAWQVAADVSLRRTTT